MPGGRVTVTTYEVAQCWKCGTAGGRVVTLNCGHHFCLSYLEGQHDNWTAGCKKPCQACFKLTVPKKSELRNLTSNVNMPNVAGLSLQTSWYKSLEMSKVISSSNNMISI